MYPPRVLSWVFCTPRGTISTFHGSGWGLHLRGPITVPQGSSLGYLYLGAPSLYLPRVWGRSSSQGHRDCTPYGLNGSFTPWVGWVNFTPGAPSLYPIQVSPVLLDDDLGRIVLEPVVLCSADIQYLHTVFLQLRLKTCYEGKSTLMLVSIEE